MSKAEQSADNPVDHSGLVDEKVALQLKEDQNEEDAAEHDFDTSKVKFINGGTACSEVCVDVEGKRNLVDDCAFVGLSKEELMKYASDPFWVRTRWILLILFWVGWFGMLAAAVIIIILAPKCPPRPSLTWWQKSLAYEVFPETFMDSNADGVGDLNGIHENLDYLSKMNISAVYLNSITEPTDYKSIKSVLGTIEDFTNMRIAMHKKGIRLILDFVPNHTSRNHTWFQESHQGASNDYSNYYVWHPGKTDVNNTRVPPNNWLSVYGGSAWEFDDVRQEYYLHQFLPDQPDLNISNPGVLAELNSVFNFWLDLGVDGFRVQNFAHLFEGSLDQDEPVSGTVTDKNDYDYLIHGITTFQSAVFELATKWHDLLSDYSKDEGRSHPRLLVVEAGDASADQITSLYKYNDKPGADMPMNVKLLDLATGCDAMCINSKIKKWTDVIPAGQTETDSWPNWQVGNSDVTRVASDSRMGPTMIRAISLLLSTLPGTTFVYYGDEIGMHNVPVTFEQTRDPVGTFYGSTDYVNHSRDPMRTPMQWSGEPLAGFSETTGSTWLPVADDFRERNVQAQNAHGSGITDLEVLKSLTAIRHEPSLSWGIMEDIIVTKDILSYVRQAQGYEGYLIAINFGTTAATNDFTAASSKFVPLKGTVVTSTNNFGTVSRMEDFKPGTEISLDALYLKPTEGVVVKFNFME